MSFFGVPYSQFKQFGATITGSITSTGAGQFFDDAHAVAIENVPVGGLLDAQFANYTCELVSATILISTLTINAGVGGSTITLAIGLSLGAGTALPNTSPGVQFSSIAAGTFGPAQASLAAATFAIANSAGVLSLRPFATFTAASAQTITYTATMKALVYGYGV
jgi:hypothetical protein